MKKFATPILILLAIVIHTVICKIALKPVINV